MTLIVLVYIVLIIIFFALSGIIIRHAVKYGYLVPTFKFVVGIFLILSAILVGLSAYFLFSAGNNKSPSVPSYEISVPAPSLGGSSEFNF